MENGITYYGKQRKEPRMIVGPFLATIFLVVFVTAVAHLTGCANVTVTQLADRCYVNGGKASVTFSGDTGKVDCR